MPEDSCKTLGEILVILGDSSFNTQNKKNELFSTIKNILEKEAYISHSTIKDLLVICVDQLNSQKIWYYHILIIIRSILNRLQDGLISEPLDLMPVSLSIINTIKTSTQLKHVETLQKLGFETIILLPDNVFNELATLDSPRLIELIEFYSQSMPFELKNLVYQYISKLLKSLSHDNRLKVVKENLPLWFDTVIPSSFRNAQEGRNEIVIDALETLTDVLVHIDYSDHPNWQHLLECIYNPVKFPQTIKRMLEENIENWDALWKVCIKLLKRQITISISSIGSPINSMLPSIELAFKMDVENRSRAFKCWNALIDNFRMETNEPYIIKRLKLLIIPLKSNNAKVEVTALAKCYTWWHLICKFQTKLDKFVDAVLISFLHFCFGKQLPQKQTFVPGLISASTKKVGAEMFIEMAGHLSCGGCVNVEKLNDSIISTKLLVDYWNDWAYSLKIVTGLYNEDIGISIQQITCLWKSFALTVCELPNNGIRKDLFDELLAILKTLNQDSISNIKNAEIVLHLINSLFADDKIITLFNGRCHPEGPIFTIFSILTTASSNVYYRSCNFKDAMLKLKPFMEYVLHENKGHSYTGQIVQWMLCDNTPLDHVPFLWTALVEILFESNCDKIANLDMLLLWPLKSYNFFTNVQYSTFVWYKLLNKVYPDVSQSFRETVINFLWSQETTSTNLIIKLYLLVVLLNHTSSCNADYEKYVELFLGTACKIDDYIEYFNDLCAPLICVLVAIMDNVSMLKVKVAKNIAKTIKSLIYCIVGTIGKDSQMDSHIKSFENFLTKLDTFIQNKRVSAFTTTMVEVLLKLPTLLDKQPSMKNCIVSVLKTCMSNVKEDNASYKNIENIINNLETDSISDSNNINSSKFTTPDVKVITRKAKKKEATIVNTVVDNGEEFIVVKSNWKFNPRKLTENQKEKLQRKREDIPALYQDLSQSQDEFKLMSWKPDSQDSSSTNSKSTSASKSNTNVGNATNILKNIPSSDVVPKIIENIMTENVKNDATNTFEGKVKVDVTNTSEVKVDKGKFSPATKKQMSMNKDPKSPRMALKDRVFKNVKSLIEKSNIQKNDKVLSSEIIEVESGSMTPPPKTVNNTNVSNLVNSAPPNISTERPSRVKRKPKKFDDVEIFSLKRSRRSSSQSDSQSNNDLIESSVNDLQENTKHDSKKLSKDEHIGHLDDTDKNNKEIKNDSEIQIENAESKSALSHNHTDIILSPQKEQTGIDVSENTDISIQSDSVKIIDIEDNKMELPKNLPAMTEIKNDVLVENGNIVGENIPSVTKIGKTPKSNKKENCNQNSTAKKSVSKKSRIEKELAIDTIEGNPFLKINTEKRITRKNINAINNSRRKSLAEKLNKSKSDNNTTPKTQSARKKDKQKTSSEFIIGESEDKYQNSSESLDDIPLSEDVIESSQDSTFTTISVTSTKNSSKKVLVTEAPIVSKPIVVSDDTQNMLADTDSNELLMENKSLVSKDDTDIPHNKTAAVDESGLNTENMDTESFGIEMKDDSSEVIVINGDEESPIVIHSNDTCIGPETQEIAEADTQPIDDSIANKVNPFEDTSVKEVIKLDIENGVRGLDKGKKSQQEDNASNETDVELTKTISESMIDMLKSEEDNTVSSPFKDEEQRKKDFLDNTFEISPIKSMSPVREKKSPSPETSSDYVVIKLSSPVQSNGEPFEKCDSPEIFTEDKVSPDKRDLSPPREENNVNNTNSPSSTLSLKRNRPQVRSGGRAAQMLGLCVPDRLQSIIMSSERSESEDTKKNSPSNTPARRNLRILYNSAADSSENCEEKEEIDNFLKFKKSLPTSDCSPSGPILKRKLAEITDDATISPASKRKRVSFHDPPVSTTISVQKYIEPCGIRSPQNSTLKRLERQNLRSQQTSLKSQKRLDNVFKLDSVLTKAVESFVEIDLTAVPNSNDTQMSLDVTPAIEIVKNSDLNDTDPICPDLIDCKDLIDNIASDLSSPTMKTMFLKELDGTIATIGDLAKMTELEVNRICIKAPKVQVAKKVLTDYASKKSLESQHEQETVENPLQPVPTECNDTKMDVETQTNDVLSKHMEVQTTITTNIPVSVQTDKTEMCENSVQTEESGCKSTKDIIISCIAEKPDFVKSLAVNLETSSKVEIAETIPFMTLTHTLLRNVTNSNSMTLITEMLKKLNSSDATNKQTELSFLQDYLCDRFDSRDLILFCSQMLAKIHDKPSL